MSTKIWVWYAGSGGGDGYVRLKLRAGEVLHTFAGGPDDEGWWRRGERWWIEDGAIHNEVMTDGQDCDGRISTHEHCVCPVEDRFARANCEGWLMPAWEIVGAGQRDYSAEAAGY